MYVLRETLSSVEIATVRAPVLVAVGENDEFAGSAHDLANLMPMSNVLTIPDLDHIGLIGSTLFQRGVVEFLRGIGGTTYPAYG